MKTIHGAFPLYEITEDGQVLHLADLHSLQPQGFRLLPKHDTIRAAVYNDLPYFLLDLMPSGFLGRLVPKTHRELGLPSNIQLWTVEQCFAFWSFFGWNLVGNLILGQRALNRYYNNRNMPSPPIAQPALNWHFPILAEQVQQEGDEGTSAGGEHPKFLIDYRQTHKSSLVKFSPPIQDEPSQRIADLLVVEHLVHEVLSEAGIPAAQSKIVRVKNQVFLEIDRFDRNEKQGRRGLISLQSLGKSVGDPPGKSQGGTLSRCTDISASLVKLQKIDPQTDLKIQELELFGSLIGNTEMNATQLSFYFERLQLGGLAPACGISSTLYYPLQNPLASQTTHQTTNQTTHQTNPPPKTLILPPKPTYTVTCPTPQQEALWHSAYKSALKLWNRTASHPQISESFREIARENQAKLSSTPFNTPTAAKSVVTPTVPPAATPFRQKKSN